MRKIIPSGIKLKLLSILVVVSFLVLVTGLFALIGIQRISNASDIVTKREIPLVRSIQEALVATITGEEAVERALSVADFSNIDQLNTQEAAFRKSIIRFDIFLTAITWGSESEAFARSSAGLTSAEWEREGLRGIVIVEPPSPEIAQLAGQTNVYFGGFNINAQKAIAAHKRFLRLQSYGGQFEEIEEVEQEVKINKERADRFLSLTIDTLTEMVKISNTATATAIKNIDQIKESVFIFVIIASLVGFVAALFISSLFATRTIIRPLRSLMQTVQEIATGELSKRAEVTSKDEIGQLATSFNEMTTKLQKSHAMLEEKVKERTAELEKTKVGLEEKAKERTADLQIKVSELERMLKLMVGREVRMAELKKEIAALKKKLGQ